MAGLPEGAAGPRWLLAGLWLVWALLCCLLSMHAFDAGLAGAVRGLPESGRPGSGR